LRDDSLDTVNPGGRPAPLGARGDAEAGLRSAVGETTPSLARLDLSTRLLLLVLGAALLAYAAVAADVVNSGRLSELDVDVATWVAGSMPSWAEWLARPFTWLGGAVGVTALVTATTIWLLTRRARVEAALLVVVAVGIQILVFSAKHGYARPRPDLGSAIALPSSYSFPSGHAATGIAVFGLLGLLAATLARTRAQRVAAVAAGFALGGLIGASRVVLGVHYVTDVLAGAFLGLAWLSTCLLVVSRVQR
jgi:undecaprenyl-diphosphatase